MLARVAVLFSFLFLVFPLLTSASVITVRGEDWQGDGKGDSGEGGDKGGGWGGEGGKGGGGGGSWGSGGGSGGGGGWGNGGGSGGPVTVKQCNTGKLQCCQSVQSAKSNAVQEVCSLLGIAVGSITGQVGLTCNPISVIGVGGNSCSAQPACCTGNSFGGGGLVGSALVVGCSPVHLNL